MPHCSGVDDKIGEMTTISIEQDDKIAFYKAQIQVIIFELKITKNPVKQTDR